MPWKRTPPEVVAAFEAARPEDPRVVTRPMFGYIAYFVNGNMIGGTFQDGIMVRVDEAEGARLIAANKALPFEPMGGRQMKGYVKVPAAAIAKPKALAAWLERALAETLKLPAKGATRPKAKATAKAKASSAAKTTAAAKAAKPAKRPPR